LLFDFPCVFLFFSSLKIIRISYWGEHKVIAWQQRWIYPHWEISWHFLSHHIIPYLSIVSLLQGRLLPKNPTISISRNFPSSRGHHVSTNFLFIPYFP
jgi:hypothetical protein